MKKQDLINLIIKYDGKYLAWENFEKKTGLHINKYYLSDCKIELGCIGAVIVAPELGSENNYRKLHTFNKFQLEKMFETLKEEYGEINE